MRRGELDSLCTLKAPIRQSEKSFMIKIDIWTSAGKCFLGAELALRTEVFTFIQVSSLFYISA